MAVVQCAGDGRGGVEGEDVQRLPALMRSSDFILNATEDFKQGNDLI